MNDIQTLALMSTLILCAGKRLGVKEAVADARAILHELVEANPTFVRPSARMRLEGNSNTAKVYKFLSENRGGAFTAQEIMKGIGRGAKRGNVAFTLSRLHASGRVVKPERGRYQYKEIASE